MIVTFCGHRTVENKKEVEAWLYKTMEQLIQSGADTFYIGGKGAFDDLAEQTVCKLKEKYGYVRSVLVLAYLSVRKTDLGFYDETVYPPIENRPRRYAILYRNQWMIEQADCVVAYVTHDWGGAYRTLSYAQKRNKPVFWYQEEKRHW